MLQPCRKRAGTGGGPWVQGRGVQAVAPQVRPAVCPPRADSERSPQPRPQRARPPPFPSAPSPAGWWAAGAREPANGGGGRRGGGAPIPTTSAGLELQTHHSPVWPVRKSSSPAHSPPKDNSGETRAHRETLGGSCLIPFSCFGGSRRSPSAPGTPPRASKRVGSQVEPDPSSDRGTGTRERRLRRPPVAGPTVCTSRERTTPRAAAAAPHPPPPRALRSTTGSRDPRLKQGVPLDSPHLTSLPSHQELFPVSQDLPT